MWKFLLLALLVVVTLQHHGTNASAPASDKFDASYRDLRKTLKESTKESEKQVDSLKANVKQIIEGSKANSVENKDVIINRIKGVLKRLRKAELEEKECFINFKQGLKDLIKKSKEDLKVCTDEKLEVLEKKVDAIQEAFEEIKEEFRQFDSFKTCDDDECFEKGMAEMQKFKELAQVRLGILLMGSIDDMLSIQEAVGLCSCNNVERFSEETAVLAGEAKECFILNETNGDFEVEEAKEAARRLQETLQKEMQAISVTLDEKLTPMIQEESHILTTLSKKFGEKVKTLEEDMDENKDINFCFENKEAEIQRLATEAHESLIGCFEGISKKTRDAREEFENKVEKLMEDHWEMENQFYKCADEECHNSGRVRVYFNAVFQTIQISHLGVPSNNLNYLNELTVPLCSGHPKNRVVVGILSIIEDALKCKNRVVRDEL